VDRRERPSTAAAESGQLDALVVLGCRVRAGEPSRALAGRLEVALRMRQAGAAKGAPPASLPIVLSGGRAWDGAREADVMASWLVARGVSREALILERDSLTTRQNARKVAAMLAGRDWRTVGLVTSDFHMRRAARLFRREGFQVIPLPAPSRLGFLSEQRMILRELGAAVLERIADGPLPRRSGQPRRPGLVRRALSRFESR